MNDDQRRYRFDEHTFDRATGDLTSPSGSTVRLRPQAGRVLALLLDHAGALVTREELQTLVWPDTIVEFDQGLNACISEIRRALSDSASQPRFIETFPRRGYRFIAVVERGQGLPPEKAGADRLGRVRWQWAAAAFVLLIGGFGVVISVAPTQSEGTPDRGRDRLMVLPFRAPGSSLAADTLADIVTDRLIADLSQLAPDRLGVIARASSARYRDTRATLAEIAAELDLDYLVEGSVAEGREVTVQVRLVDARDQTQVWASQWPVEADGVGVVAERAGQGVALAIAPTLGEAHRTLVVRRAGDSATRDALARVQWLLARHTMDATQRALTLLEPALAAESDHPELLEALATIRLRFGDEDAASDAARRALEVQPASGRAHGVLGQLAQRRMAWDSARTHMERAVRLSPANPELRTNLAFLLNYLGDNDGASDQAEAALALDPVSATLSADAGIVFLLARRYAQAERHCSAAIQLDPEARSARRCLVRLAALTGRPDVGAQAALDLLRMDGPGDPGVAGSEALDSYWLWAREEYATDGCGPVGRARAEVVLGQTQEASTRLATLDEGSDRCLLDVAADPLFDRVREDPAVVGRMARLGLPARR